MFVFWIRQLKVKSLQKNNFNLKRRLQLLMHDKQLRQIHFSKWSIFWLLVEVIMELLDRFTKLFSFSSADSRRCWIDTGVLLVNLLQLLLFRNFQVFRWNNWFELWWWFFFPACADCKHHFDDVGRCIGGWCECLIIVFSVGWDNDSWEVGT